jgi:membrane-associated phospholipid phosphatase
MKIVKSIFLKVLKDNGLLFSFILILLYLSYINLFVIRSTPEIIFLQFTILVLAYKKIRREEFLKSWLPFIGLFVLFEFLRGYADDLSPFYNLVLYWGYELEMIIFGKLPTLFLQEKLAGNRDILYISIFFYTTFFYYSFLIAFLLWLKKPEIFHKYVRGFLLLTYIGLLLHFLIPTAPPWLVNETQNLGIQRLLYKQSAGATVGWLSIYKHFVGGNPVAAMPSLHVAWPTFSTLFLIKETRKKIFNFLLIVPLGIAFAIVFTGEHYIVDVLAGWLLAFGVVFLRRKKE